jgi:E3 ubiquitin-protein ligase RNF14
MTPFLSRALKVLLQRHGPLTPCASSFLTILLTEYLSLPILSPRRKILETRIGKKQLEKYLKAKEEEDMNKRWLNEKTMACTGCGVQVEKNEGMFFMLFGAVGATMVLIGFG